MFMKFLILLLLVISLLFLGCTTQQQTNQAKEQTKQQNDEITGKLNISNGNIQKIDENDVGEINDSYIQILDDENLSEIDESDLTSKDIESIEDINDNRFPIYYFYSPACPFCTRIKPKIDELEIKYNNSIKFIRYNVIEQKDLDIYNNFTMRYNVSQRVVPLVFVNDKHLSGIFEINDSLESLIKNATNS